MQAADLISRIAVVIKQCNEDILMSHMGTVLFEYLGEEYPEVLGSIIGKLFVGLIGGPVQYIGYLHERTVENVFNIWNRKIIFPVLPC